MLGGISTHNQKCRLTMIWFSVQLAIRGFRWNFNQHQMKGSGE
jgi:hypothetical protein